MKKFAILALVTGLVACSGSQDASKGNFEKAINQYYQDNDLCLAMAPLDADNMQKYGLLDGVNGRYGDKTIKIIKKNSNGDTVNRHALKQMAVLVDEKIYELDKDEKIPSSGKKDLQVAVYQLTSNGTKFFKETATGPRLCVGKQKVKKIDWFTEPTTADGMIVSQVVYERTYKLDKFADKLIKQGQDDLANYVADGQNGRSLLVLTNEGWKDHRLLR